MKFTIEPELLLPFIISNAMAVLILWYSFRRPHLAQGFLAILFFGSAGFNLYTSIANPAAYMSFATTTFSSFYKDLIRGFFSQHVTIFVSAIAVGQLFIATSMLLENIRFRLGCVAGFIFGIAIAPLGVGSAFPSSLILSLSFLVLFLKKETSHIPT
jgi:hypothetical protein